MKNRVTKLLMLLISNIVLCNIQIATAQVSFEKIIARIQTDSITQILEDEISGKVIKVFQNFDYSLLTKYTYVKNMPCVRSGFILENGQRLELPINEHIDCFNYNYLITSNANEIEGKTVFILYRIYEFDGIAQLTKIDSIISNGDFSISKILTGNRILIRETQEGGVETNIHIYDINLKLIKQIKPYSDFNVIGSSYAVKDSVLLYSVEPDECNSAGVPSPKIMMINMNTGEINKEVNIINIRHSLQIMIIDSILIGYWYNNLFGFDMNLNKLWERKDIALSKFTFLKDDIDLLIVSTLKEIIAINILNGDKRWEDKIERIIGNELNLKLGDNYDINIFSISCLKKNNYIVLIIGGSLKTDRHCKLTQLPRIIESHIAVFDSRMKLISVHPIDLNEYIPIHISTSSSDNALNIDCIQERIKLKVNESK